MNKTCQSYSYYIILLGYSKETALKSNYQAQQLQQCLRRRLSCWSRSICTCHCRPSQPVLQSKQCCARTCQLLS